MPIPMIWLLALLQASPAPPAPPDPGFTLKIVAPDPLYLVGRARVRAAALDAAGRPYARISWMTLSVDGREQPPDSKPPFEWDIDVGADLDRHRLELTAVTRDGGRSKLSVLSAARPFVEAVGVDLVLIPAVVRAGGRPVSGLTSADFTVLEDGVPVRISSFSAEPLPASIAVALDNSASMEGHLWSAQKAIAQFVQGRPPYTAFSFLTFNDQVFLEQDFTYDARMVTGAVAAARSEGTRTALYDALRIGSRYLSRRPGARVLVIFTDGQDTVYEGAGSEGHLRTSIDAAQAADVAVFAVAYGKTRSAEGAAALAKMTEETGGEVVSAGSAEELRDAFERIGESIGSRYVIGYEPPQPNKPGYRRVEVRVLREGTTVLARRGYLMR